MISRLNSRRLDRGTRLAIVTAAGAALCGSALCDEAPLDYVFAGGAADKSAVTFVEARSIQRRGEALKYWALTVNTPPKNVGARSVLYTRIMAYDNCVNDNMRFDYIIEYDSEGKVIGQTPGNGAEIPIIPESTWSSVHEYVCRGEKLADSVPEATNIADAIKLADRIHDVLARHR